MASSKLKNTSDSIPLSQIANKQKRRLLHVKRKRALESAKREERFRRKKEESKNPRLREERHARNVPLTIEKKRVWDGVDGLAGDGLGLSVDVERVKRRKLEADEERAALEQQKEEQSGQAQTSASNGTHKGNLGNEADQEEEEDDKDSMLDFESDSEASDISSSRQAQSVKQSSRSTAPTQQKGSPSPSATEPTFDPIALQTRFPTLFNSPQSPPKLLLTTSFNATIPLHTATHTLTTLFPSSVYIPRSAHHHSHKYSIREISRFASSRNYTALLVLTSDLSGKSPQGLSITHLPHGPTFHFSIRSFLPGHAIPGHGNPTNHIPELILNNFRTPLGHLAAALFRSLFPPKPDVEGRQVLTLHNQRDYIFLRRHRYVFRDKRGTEKSVVGPDGKMMEGVEDIRAGLQELGPRMTLKLRRVDEGVGRGSGVAWEWKAGSEKARTRFMM